jgi:heat shock protein HslJ
MLALAWALGGCAPVSASQLVTQTPATSIPTLPPPTATPNPTPDPTTSPAVPEVIGIVWEWERFLGNDDTTVDVDDPSRYTLILNPDGTYQVRADCNRANGAYELDGSHLTLQPGPTTLAECEPGSLYSDFLAKLGHVRTYFLDDGMLVLDLWADGGHMLFRPPGTPGTSVSLDGTLWRLDLLADTLGGLVDVLAGTEITAQFQGGQILGSAGCNRYFASYEIDGESISFGPVGATRRFCGQPEGIMEQENAYLAALGLSTSYRIQGDRLELIDEDGVRVATFVATEEATDGAGESADIVGILWHWQSTLTPMDKTVVDDPARYTLELSPDGQAFVQADCNVARGTYTIEDSHVAITINATTRAACPAGSLGDQFLKELNAAAIYFIEDGDLFIDMIYDSGTMRFVSSE